MLFDLILDALFPAACIGCDKQLARGALLCAICFDDIRVNQTLFCGMCNARLPDNRRICHLSSPYVYGGATEYHDDRVRALVRALKFKYARRAVEPLSQLLIPYARITLPQHVLRNSLVVPMPLSRSRERQRGFNQAYLLAQIIADAFDLPLVSKLLIRAHNTKPQSDIIGTKERHANVAGCFAIGKTNIALSRKPILLVDDVRTSGATLNEAARTLKSGGAGPIFGLVVARA